MTPDEVEWALFQVLPIEMVHPQADVESGVKFTVPAGTVGNVTWVSWHPGKPDRAGHFFVRFKGWLGSKPGVVASDDHRWSMNPRSLARLRLVEPKPDRAHFPHRCPGCGSAAYVGFLDTYCASRCGKLSRQW